MPMDDGLLACHAWAAGLFEGEGSVVQQLPSGFLRLQVKMTDLDVLQTFREVCGGFIFGPYSYPSKDGYHRKPVWAWVTGRQKDAEQLLVWWWPWLHRRRKARAIEILGRLPRGAPLRLM